MTHIRGIASVHFHMNDTHDIQRDSIRGITDSHTINPVGMSEVNQSHLQGDMP